MANDIPFRGDLFIELGYDLIAEVKETQPEKTVALVHGLNPKKYLVLPNSDMVFPDEYLSKIKSELSRLRRCINVESTANLAGNYLADHLDLELRLDSCKNGAKKRISLIFPVSEYSSISLLAEESKKPHFIDKTSLQSVVRFQGTMLESMLRNHRKQFADLVKKTGIEILPCNIYTRFRVY